MLAPTGASNRKPLPLGMGYITGEFSYITVPGDYNPYTDDASLYSESEAKKRKDGIDMKGRGSLD